MSQESDLTKHLGESNGPDQTDISQSQNGSSKRRRIDPSNKKKRIDYKNPENAARLQAAIQAVNIAPVNESTSLHKNISIVAKAYDLPTNTLRDNYLRTKGIDTRAGRKKEGERKKSTGTSQSPTTDAVGDT